MPCGEVFKGYKGLWLLFVTGFLEFLPKMLAFGACFWSRCGDCGSVLSGLPSKRTVESNESVRF